VLHDLLHPFTLWIIFLCLLILVLHIPDRDKRIFILSIVLSTQVFFAVAATKMLSYTLFLLPLYLIAVAHGITLPFQVIKALRIRRWGVGLALTTMAGFLLNIELTQHRHTIHEPAEGFQLHRRQQLAVLEAEPLIVEQLGDPERTILFNVPKVYDVQFMFRHGYLSMRGLPSEEVVQRLRAKGYTIKALQDGMDPAAFPQGIEMTPDSVASFPNITRL